MIPWPNDNMTLTDWADSLRLLRPDIEIQPRMDDEDDWKTWASSVLQSKVLQTANSPSSDAFNDWKTWAEALIKSLGNNA